MKMDIIQNYENANFVALQVVPKNLKVKLHNFPHIQVIF